MDYTALPEKSRTMFGTEVQKTFKIFCGNLASGATKEDLHYLFSQYGPVVEAVVVAGKDFGFVHMAYEEDGYKAICELRGRYLHGRAMAVEASINSKKAMPAHKHNIIGRSMAALDDFGDPGSKPRIPEQRDKLSDFPYRTPDSPALTAPATPTSPIAPVSPVTRHTPPGLFPQNALIGQPSPIGAHTQSPIGLSHTPGLAPPHSPAPIGLAPPLEFSVKGEKMSVDANSNPIQDSLADKTETSCGFCGRACDEWQHSARVVSCGHTFCCDCLVCLARNAQFTCPLPGCGVTSVLSDQGLSANCNSGFPKFPVSSIPASIPSIPPSIPSQPPSIPMMPPGFGQQNGTHSPSMALPEAARDGLRGQLRARLDVSMRQLRHAMTMRAAMKERLERTVLSVEKFVEELKRKVEGEQLEEAVLQDFLSDLNAVNDTLTDASHVTHLVDSLHKVHSYSSIINTQYNQCRAVTAINNATEAIVVKLKQSALESALASIGFRSEEAFAMTSSLEQHAMYGNNANVLLLYMLSDLLSSRMLQLSAVSPISLSPSHPSPLPSSSVQSPMSNPIASPGLAIPSKVNDVKAADNLNVEHILQMTEAIEKGSLLGSGEGMGAGMGVGMGASMGTGMGAGAVGSESVPSALSLGLSSLSFIGGTEAKENGKEEVESLPEKKEPTSFSYVDAAKKPAKPCPESTKVSVQKTIATLTRALKFPHCWMTLSINGAPAGRIIFELRPDKAPKMCDNFVALCTGKNGYGYKGTHFFKSGEGFLAGGDVENDDGTGGYSAYDKKCFEADLCPLKDEVGMIRFKGIGTSDAGRGMVGSQFMIWCGEREFKKFSYSLVFGKVVDGLDVAKKAAAVNVHRVSVKIEDCGAV